MARLDSRQARLIEQLEAIARLESHVGAADIVPERWNGTPRGGASSHVSRTFVTARHQAHGADLAVMFWPMDSGPVTLRDLGRMDLRED